MTWLKRLAKMAKDLYAMPLPAVPIDPMQAGAVTPLPRPPFLAERIKRMAAYNETVRKAIGDAADIRLMGIGPDRFGNDTAVLACGASTLDVTLWSGITAKEVALLCATLRKAEADRVATAAAIDSTVARFYQEGARA